MLFLLGGVIGLVLGVLAGGRLGNLAQVRLRWPLVVILALVVKEAGLLSPLSRSPAAPWLFAASLAALIAWALWHTGALHGIEMVAAGMALNLVVVVANSGHMPVAESLATRGLYDLTRGPIGQYVLATPSTHLNWLGDWIGLPGGLGRTFSGAYSPGDLVAFLGMVVVMFLATRSRPLQTPVEGATVR